MQEATKMLSIYLDNHESASCTDMKELFSMQMGTKLCPGQLEITESDLVLYQKVEWSLLSLPTLALVSMYCSKKKIYYTFPFRECYSFPVAKKECSRRSRRRLVQEDKRMVLVYTHGLFIT